MSCDYQSIVNASKCYECIPPNAQMGVHTWLLKSISGYTGDVNSLMNAARCIASCIPPGMLNEVKTRLLCEVVDNLVPPAPPVVECVPDSDAQAFITAAGLTDETQINSVCQLVNDLKTYPAVGTKYWDREDLIYPFVGGTSVAHAVNLKSPLGTNNLTFLGWACPSFGKWSIGRFNMLYANTQLCSSSS